MEVEIGLTHLMCVDGQLLSLPHYCSPRESFLLIAFEFAKLHGITLHQNIILCVKLFITCLMEAGPIQIHVHQLHSMLSGLYDCGKLSVVLTLIG